MKRNTSHKKPNFLISAHTTLRKKSVVATVYVVLRLMVITVMIAQFFNGNFENVFLCGLTLVLFLLPTIFEKQLQIDLPNALEIIILLFIFAAEILGEIRAFYTTFAYWDTMLHTTNGFLCAAIGFALVDILNRTERVSLNLSPFYMAVVAFCFSMTVGVMWEFFEFAMDHFLHFDMQKDTILNAFSTVNLDPNHGTAAIMVDGIQDVILVMEDGTQRALGLGGYLDIGLIDTMADLFVNFIGAVIFSVIGFFYVKGRGHSRFAPRFIPQVLPEETSSQEE